MRANRIVIRDATTEPYAFLGTIRTRIVFKYVLTLDSMLVESRAILFCCRLLLDFVGMMENVYTFCIHENILRSGRAHTWAHTRQKSSLN